MAAHFLVGKPIAPFLVFEKEGVLPLLARRCVLAINFEENNFSHYNVLFFF